MSTDRVKMKHAESKMNITIPRSQVENAKRRGWYEIGVGGPVKTSKPKEGGENGKSKRK